MARRRLIAVISAWALSRVAPGASLPNTLMPGPARGVEVSSGRHGIQNPCDVGNPKPFGITPTIV